MDTQKILTDHTIVRASIEKNLDAIKELVKEAKDLQNIIDKLKKAWNNENIVTWLEQSVKHINESVSTLLEQTNVLFDAYKWIIHSALDS